MLSKCNHCSFAICPATPPYRSLKTFIRHCGFSPRSHVCFSFFFSPRAKTMEIYPRIFPVEKIFFKLLCDYWPVLVLSVGAAKPDLCSLSPWPATSAVARSRWSFSLTGSYILLWWWFSVFYLLSCVCRLYVFVFCFNSLSEGEVAPVRQNTVTIGWREFQKTNYRTLTIHMCIYQYVSTHLLSFHLNPYCKT